MASMANQDSFVGCLIGQGVGDALGFIVEGCSPADCEQYLESIKPVALPTMTRLPQFTFGQYSDDTQLARELLISFVQTRGRVDPAHYALRIAMMFQPHAYRIVGYGKQTAAGAENVRKGLHHSACGITSGQGNGSAMRSAPIGLILADQPDSVVIKVARTLSAITHASESTMEGAAAVALAAKFAMLGRDKAFDRRAFLKYVCQGVSPSFAACIKKIPEAIKTNTVPGAAQFIVGMGAARGESEWPHGIGHGVLQTVVWALLSVCSFPDSFVDCMGIAIRVAGDVDTTAAIAGAIVGARVGVGAGAIPAVWASRLHDLEEWKEGDLVKLAQDAYKLVADKRVVLNLIEQL